MLEECLGVTIALLYHALGTIGAEKSVVVQRPRVFGANLLHAFSGKALEFLELAVTTNELAVPRRLSVVLNGIGSKDDSGACGECVRDNDSRTSVRTLHE